MFSLILFPPAGFESGQHGFATVRGVDSPVDSLMHWTVHERILSKPLCGHHRFHQWENLFRSDWWILSFWLPKKPKQTTTAKKQKQWKPCVWMYLFLYFHKLCLLIFVNESIFSAGSVYAVNSPGKMILSICLSIYPDSIYWSWCWTNRIVAFAADLYYVIQDEKGRIFDVGRVRPKLI